MGKDLAVHHAEVRPGVQLAFLDENPGGRPLLLVHGWPETMRIWWRNVEPLAAQGWRVIVPDLRGFGGSSPAPDGFYDLAAHARDLAALLEHLGVGSCVACGGDLGGGVVQDLGLRFDGLVDRQVLFNCVLPLLPDAYAQAGLDVKPGAVTRQAADYFARQGRDADALVAELRTPEERRRYVASFYGSRFWASPGSFTPQDVDFMTEPFADADKLRAGFGNYESALGTIPLSEPPRFFEVSAVPTVVLYGPDDHVIWPDFMERCQVAFTDRVGPLVVPRSGHFLQWERANVLNGVLGLLV